MTNILKFAFQGVYGAYSEEAGKDLYPNSKSIACKTFEEMFENVRDGKADVAIVPIENSRAGRVADTQRLIPESNLKIIGEYFLKVKHCLLALPGANLEDILRIHSHEQAIAQCRNNIIKQNKDMIVAADTAGSAKMISEMGQKEEAAIASDLAAETYNLKVLISDFQDADHNVTRFLIMSKDLIMPAIEEQNVMTTLVFELKSIPAALY